MREERAPQAHHTQKLWTNQTENDIVWIVSMVTLANRIQMTNSREIFSNMKSANLMHLFCVCVCEAQTGYDK